MKRTRASTSSSESSHKKQRSSGTAQLNITDEEYATCLKVLQQVNEATTETLLEILLVNAQSALKHVLVNLTTRVSTDESLSLVCGQHWNGKTANLQTIAVLESNRDDAFHYDVETSRLDLVQEVWEHEIIPYLNVKELALLRPTCKWCDQQWLEFLKRNTFRVPEQVPTLEEAMRVGFNLSKQKEYSKGSPLVVVLSEGEHLVKKESYLNITCSNISFIGQGQDKTTVCSRIDVENKKNVSFAKFTLTNANGEGLWVTGEEASVTMLSVSVENCGNDGLYAKDGASIKATQCEFSENGSNGLYMDDGSKGFITDCSIYHNGNEGVNASDEGTLVEFRGEQTEIHNNQGEGLYAHDNAIINIYIPSQPITTLVHGNGEGSDFYMMTEGKIQSQLSSSSLELTLIHGGEAPEDDEDEEDY